MALQDRGSDDSAAEADGRGDEAPADGFGSRQETVTKVLPTAAPEPVTSAEDPAATVVDIIPQPLAGGVAASAAAAGAAAASAGTADTRIMAARGGAGRGSRPRPSWKIATAAAGAAAVIAGGLVIVAVSGSSHGRTTASAVKSSTEASRKKTAEAVSVVSVSPANGSTGVNGTAPITVTYSGRITNTTALPTTSPRIAGSWQVSADKATFVPQVGFTEETHVTVHIPPSSGPTTAAALTFRFTTGDYSVLRLDQLLSQLGYIPVTWTPTDPAGDIPATDASAQLAAAYNPPAGTFTFDSGYPSALTSMWSAGTDNEIIDGAVRTFEFDHGLTMDGDAGRHVWSHLLTAVARDEQNQHGYTYVWVTQAGTEHLDLYHNGQLAITSPVNTGIAGRSTADGTFPVYLRYQVTQMAGTNPDGTKYNDTVYWVSYFNGGDAVHAFPRASYGFYQSLGCVELPSYGSTAEDVWNLITYGTLVTVTGPLS